jgi:CubicO group peptidase (beta-lactamase class C family)
MEKQLPYDFHIDRWQDGPLNRWAFQHVSEFLATDEILAKDICDTSEIPVNPSVANVTLIENIEVNVDGKSLRLSEILEETHTDSMIVLRNGKIVYERYFHSMKIDSKHLLQSISKSILGVLYAIMIDRGVIDPEKSMSHYLPELTSSVFGTATIAQALDMRVAIKFTEDYASPDSEMSRLDRACGWKANPTGEYSTLRSFLLSLTARITDVHVEHGSEFQYCSATTDVLAWLISHVTGVSYSKLLEREIWWPMGARQNANITVDSEGLAVGNGGISSTTRDMALFGQVILNGGKALGGEQVIPMSWITNICLGDRYKNQWWISNQHEQYRTNEIHARGIYGQYLWIDHDTNTVIAKFSSDPHARNTPKFGMHTAMFRSISHCVLEP